MDEARRNALGLLGLVVGTVLLAAGVIWAHYAAFPQTEIINGIEVSVDVDYFGWIPRGLIIEFGAGGVPWFTLGHIVAFVGSQLILVGALFLWVLDRRMTWARAAFTALVTWMELILIFGTVPSEWLNLAQGPLGWTSQSIALTIPPVLVLGNELQVSYAAIKDIISISYNQIMLVAAIVFAYQIQGWGKRTKPAPGTEIGTSPYGRPLVRGS